VLGGDRAAPRMGLGPAPSARIEYGANTLTLELVAGLDEAVEHIHANGSGHTESIITGARRAGRTMSRPHSGWREQCHSRQLGTACSAGGTFAAYALSHAHASLHAVLVLMMQHLCTATCGSLVHLTHTCERGRHGAFARDGIAAVKGVCCACKSGAHG